jgi:Xaa-Pro aminopeptidase
MSVVKARLKILRKTMEENNIQACIIPSSDPHQSEYISECWKFREFMSGFTGSFGTLVIGMDKAGFWTDSRYFLQAETELMGSSIELFKLKLPETPILEKWIAEQKYASVGIDGSLFSTFEALRLSEYFSKKGISFKATFKPYTQVWPDRPSSPQDSLIVFPESLSGESIGSKIERTRQFLQSSGADCITLSSLDEIAWLFNFRGLDVEFNPVAICNAFIDMNSAHLFVGLNKLNDDMKRHLSENNVLFASYEEYPEFISNLRNASILFDKARNNFDIYQRIHPSCKEIDEISPVASMKSIKNRTEIEGFRTAMIKDGIALTRLFRWIESETSAKNPEDYNFPTEYDICEKAASLRKEQGEYLCESFSPIVSFREHGAIVHYEPTKESSSVVSGEGVLLIDLGGHYLNGTTDMTRTLYLNGTPPQKYKEDYTSLLKGVIALTKASFPAGTRGSQLDILARKFIWDRGLNYLHGTGHGVGHCLYVHEGPQSIRMEENPVTIKPGMIMSNEPGIYRTGEYGVRVENVILCNEKENTGFGRFFNFETLTLVPLDLKSIDARMLDEEEKKWINDYSRNVYYILSPRLEEDERKWLLEKTTEI